MTKLLIAVLTIALLLSLEFGIKVKHQACANLCNRQEAKPDVTITYCALINEWPFECHRISKGNWE